MNGYMQSDLSTRIVRIKDVLRMTSLSKTTHFAKLDKKSGRYDPTYPKPVRLGARSVGYIEQEVLDWIEARMGERN